MKRQAVIATIAGLFTFAVLGCVICLAEANRPHKKSFRVEMAALMGASGLYVTTLNKSAYQSPSSVSFQTLSKSFTSSAVSILDQTLSASSSSSVMTGANSGNIQMLYGYTTTLDGTLNLYSNTQGTGSVAASVALTAGVPYEWDSLTSGTSAMILSNTNSIVFTAGTTSGGSATANTQTTINAAGMFP